VRRVDTRPHQRVADQRIGELKGEDRGRAVTRPRSLRRRCGETGKRSGLGSRCPYDLRVQVPSAPLSSSYRP
jgi:hypothetical protein